MRSCQLPERLATTPPGLQAREVVQDLGELATPDERQVIVLEWISKRGGHGIKVADLCSYAWTPPRSATARSSVRFPLVNGAAEPSAYAAVRTVNAGHERLRMRHDQRCIRRSLNA